MKLSDFKGKKVVVYFYPKADTPGCTTQSCALRDAEPDLKKLKAVVLGISPDTPEKQLKFDEKYDLGFTLLADNEHKVAEKYGVWGEKMIYGRKYMGIVRSAFVVDEPGSSRACSTRSAPRTRSRRSPRCSKNWGSAALRPVAWSAHVRTPETLTRARGRRRRGSGALPLAARRARQLVAVRPSRA